MGSLGIVDRWVQYREQKTVRRQKEAELSELIERMVSDSYPSLRQVSGYREQLQGPAENALGHIKTLIGAIPGPFRLSAAGWDKDSLTHALFVSPDEIRSLLKKCAELTAFFRKSGSKSATALLTATKKERTAFGTALEGEILRRDVPFTAVEFYDHRVIAPAGTEGEHRRELVHRGLHVLASNALQEFIQSTSIREELEAQHRILDYKLKILQTRERRMECLLAGVCSSDPEAGEARKLLMEIDKQLMELEQGSGTPHDFLKKLEKVLAEPGNFLTEKPITMNLDWMGMKQNDSSTVTGRAINLSELEMPDKLKRIAVLVDISAEECMGK